MQPLFDRLLGVAGRIPEVGPVIARNRSGIATFLASSTSAAGALRLLNSCNKPGQAGRTLDLTFFAVTKALDVVIGEIWARRKARRVSSGKFTKFEARIGSTADAAVFSLSTAVIMFSWFYLPDRLPA